MKQRADLTFKYNKNLGRHGWLRLTPAYSVKLVSDILDQLDSGQVILEPFCGTGTTGVSAAEHGFDCDLADINPFLVWFTNAKTKNYSAQQRELFDDAGKEICRRAMKPMKEKAWLPDLHNIERWWNPGRLTVLAEIRAHIDAVDVTPTVRDLLKIAFCPVMIEWSNAAFNHQSMSFHEADQSVFELDERDEIASAFGQSCARISSDVSFRLSGKARAYLADSRSLEGLDDRYTSLITSPPYPNRMSYIRELRPYMYWLGFLDNAKEAGELDWKAIGGTWGCATSRVGTWEPKGHFEKKHKLIRICSDVAKKSLLLANYIHKYFEDMSEHCVAVKNKMRPDAHVFYIVGNSKFYDTMVPVEELYADMLLRAGFVDAKIDRIRKRNSKKELYEFLVSASTPAATRRPSLIFTQTKRLDLPLFS